MAKKVPHAIVPAPTGPQPHQAEILAYLPTSKGDREFVIGRAFKLSNGDWDLTA